MAEDSTKCVYCGSTNGHRADCTDPKCWECDGEGVVTCSMGYEHECEDCGGDGLSHRDG